MLSLVKMKTGLSKVQFGLYLSSKWSNRIRQILTKRLNCLSLDWCWRALGWGWLQERYFPKTKQCAHANQVILVVKCESHHHSPMSSSENVVVVKTSYQNLMLGNRNKLTNFCGEKSTMLLSKVSMFRE